MKRFSLLAIGLALVLAACSTAPITIDLIPYLGDRVSGSETVSATGRLDLQLPDANGYTVSGFEAPALRPNSVVLDYALTLEQNGGLSGDAELTFYLAASDDDLWSAANQLGEPVDVDLNLDTQTLTGQLALSPAQIDALMSGSLKVGATLTGNATGTANVSYTFDRLLLKVAFF
ncbi:hypothetical protein [Oceanithermus sp.]